MNLRNYRPLNERTNDTSWICARVVQAYDGTATIIAAASGFSELGIDAADLLSVPRLPSGVYHVKNIELILHHIDKTKCIGLKGTWSKQ